MIAPGALLARVHDIADPGAIVVKFDSADARGSLIFDAARRQRSLRFTIAARTRAIRCSAPTAACSCRRAATWSAARTARAMTLDTGACAGGPCNGDALTRIAVDVRDGEVRLAPASG